MREITARQSIRNGKREARCRQDWLVLMAVMLAVFVTACANTSSPVTAPLIDQSPQATVTREEVLRIAEAYRMHRWRSSTANVRHGIDAAGVRVDTPDVRFVPTDGTRPGWWLPGSWNVGVPYQWGGFDTLAEFDRKVAAGFAAGDIYTQAKRAGLERAVSREAAGIDCSGFISRCWRLDRSVSTRELTRLCVPLKNYRELEPGDVLNVHNSHVVLFAGWLNGAKTHMLAYETGVGPTWKVLRHVRSCEELRARGYKPYRYRHIRS